METLSINHTLTSLAVDSIYTFTEFQWPPPLSYYIGILAVCTMTGLSSAGGINGAGANIPFLMIFFGLHTKECVPIANAFGFTASLMRFLINYKGKHPDNNEKVLVDYEIVSLTMPMIYMGTLLGVWIG
jgi:uncharacterized membrane protein YfcA